MPPNQVQANFFSIFYIEEVREQFYSISCALLASYRERYFVVIIQ